MSKRGLLKQFCSMMHLPVVWMPVLWLIASAISVSFAVSLADELDQATDILLENAREGAASQKKIDALDDETRQAVFEYRALSKQNESLTLYISQLKVLLKDQENEVVRKEEEIIRVKSFEREIMPLLGRMVGALEQLLEKDIPFLRDERRERVQKLKAMMSQSDVNIAGKFRRIFEAYQIEADYGRNIETYQGSVTLASGEDRKVNFLRVGRNVLIYETLDGNERAVWDDEMRQWHSVSDDYGSMIRKAIRIAKKQAAPDLLILPVAAPRQLKPKT